MDPDSHPNNVSKQNIQQIQEEINEEQRLVIDIINRAEATGDGHLADEPANASFVSSIHSNQSNTQESHTSGSSQNVCALCGRENPEIKPFQLIDDDASSSAILSFSSSLLAISLPSQEAAKQRKQQVAAQMLMRTTEEEASEWIFCDVCRKWYHALCVNVQQYELPLIDKYHCTNCQAEHGESIMKIKRLTHRHAFDNESERNLPIQIGTEAWTQNFGKIYMQIPEATSPDVLCLYENGHDLMQDFNFGECWKQPIKVINERGLGLRMPEEPDFDVIDVLKLLGEHVTVDTIDVFAQQSYTMSLHRFYKLWNGSRERLYNILSLEFSETKLAEIVQSPSLVRELSWVQRYWPHTGQKEGKNEGIYAFTDNPTWHPNQEQQEGARPYVEHFCLMGMRGSYTDFHIDFGGSSVWYHVFRGEKVFFIAPPSGPNLEAFLRWQKDKQRSEKFFGDLLPPGEKLYRLLVREGETLLLPSGWIHSVYTPVDSLVFGGNFLHSLNVPMQLKVFEMEAAAEIEERFKFPYFELCNFYAAKNIAQSLMDSSFEDKIADQVILNAAEALVSKCDQWVRGPVKKFYMFNGTLKLLEKELGRQRNLQRRLCEKRSMMNAPFSSSSPVNAHSPQITDIISEPKLRKMDTQDLDSSWEEMEEEEEEEEEEMGGNEEHELEEEEEGAEDEEEKPTTSKASKRKKHNRLKIKQSIERGILHEGSSNSGRHQTGAVFEIESSGPIKLKLKLPMQIPCWHRHPPSPTAAGAETKKKQKKISTAITFDAEAEGDVDVGSLFRGRSTHGRKLRPTSRIANMDDPTVAKKSNLSDAFSSDDKKRGCGDANDSDFVLNECRNRGGGGRKNFMAQFSAEERKRIELAEKAGEMDARGTLFSPLDLETKKKKRISQQKNKQPKADLFEGGASSSSISISQQNARPGESLSFATPSVEKKAKKSAAIAMNSRQRLAKKLGLMRKK